MMIAIDISPLISGHSVRGTGFYLRNLKDALVSYFPNHAYSFFSKGEKIPEGADIVHYPYLDPFFITLPLTKKYKTIVTVHDLIPLVFPQAFPSGIRGRVKWEIQKRLLSGVDAVITDSLSSSKDINHYINISEEKVHVVYLAAGKEYQQVDTKTKNKIKEKYVLPDRFILYVGDATWNKNLPLLIKAVNKTQYPFVVVGKVFSEGYIDKNNIWNKDLLEAKRLFKENNNIKILGFIPTEDLVGIYNNAAVLLMPSLYEGFGLPVLEAMSCGCPVITSKKGSLTEIAGNAACYVNSGDEEEISESIKEIMSNTKKRNLLKEKGLLQAKKFSWQKTAEQTMEVYEKVFRGK